MLADVGVRWQAFVLVCVLECSVWARLTLVLPGAVVGRQEREKETVNVRTRDNQVHGEMSLLEVIDFFRKLKVRTACICGCIILL